ncbi:hypothetical protein [Streptomyces sp. NPDC006739]|uniref:hypothetical protein n=1 Tax=Streptomyces sp. NPDC006739 TaxID=3364763 RepID=UPI0036927C35
MSVICNVIVEQPPEGKQERIEGAKSTSEKYRMVDTPIATGSAHLMRAGSELHLLHSDLELNNLRQAAVRVSCAGASISAALDEYESSHQVAKELEFYPLHDARVREARGGSFRIPDTLREAESLGMINLDEASIDAIDRVFEAGGEEAAFSHFLAELREFRRTLADFDVESANEDPSQWQHFAWTSITAYDHIRVHGQALAIINTFGVSKVLSAAIGA